MRAILGLILFFSIFGVGNAHAQSTIEEFSAKLNSQSEATQKIQGNLFQMMQG